MSSTQAHLLSWLDLLDYVGTGNFHVICITAVHSLCCPPLVSGSFSSQRYSLAYFSSIIEWHTAEELLHTVQIHWDKGKEKLPNLWSPRRYRWTTEVSLVPLMLFLRTLLCPLTWVPVRCLIFAFPFSLAPALQRNDCHSNKVERWKESWKLL